MGIPVSSTTISITRPTGMYVDDIQRTVIAKGIRAVIIPIRGTETRASRGGQQSFALFRLTADLCDLGHEDTVTDESTGYEFQVDWTQPVKQLLPHMRAQISRVVGQ